jgi:hypothetical protein
MSTRYASSSRQERCCRQRRSVPTAGNSSGITNGANSPSCSGVDGPPDPALRDRNRHPQGPCEVGPNSGSLRLQGGSAVAHADEEPHRSRHRYEVGQHTLVRLLVGELRGTIAFATRGQDGKVAMAMEFGNPSVRGGGLPCPMWLAQGTPITVTSISRNGPFGLAVRPPCPDSHELRRWALTRRSVTAP